ncbi:MAG: DMT family transporter [Pseudomonadota bacterium]
MSPPVFPSLRLPRLPSRAGATLMALSPNARGALWILLSVAGATGMTLFVREASAEVHSVMLAFLRSVLSLLPVLLLVPRLAAGLARGAVGDGPRPIRFRAWRWHMARGLALAGALNGGFYAIWQLPVATASALFFLAPVFATLASMAVTGERVGIRRWLAVLAGFFGALVILRPGAQALEPAMLAAVGSAMCYGLCLVLGRVAADRDGPDAVFASSSVVLALATLPPALFVWSVPVTLAAWGLIAGVVVFSALRTYTDIRAYAIGDAGFLAPFSYLRLLTVGIAGYWLFGEVPDAATWAGGALIIAATLYIALRERQLSRSRGPGAA